MPTRSLSSLLAALATACAATPPCGEPTDPCCTAGSACNDAVAACVAGRCSVDCVPAPADPCGACLAAVYTAGICSPAVDLCVSPDCVRLYQEVQACLCEASSAEDSAGCFGVLVEGVIDDGFPGFQGCSRSSCADACAPPA
jgi:hypothetical protein